MKKANVTDDVIYRYSVFAYCGDDLTKLTAFGSSERSVKDKMRRKGIDVIAVRRTEEITVTSVQIAEVTDALRNAGVYEGLIDYVVSIM